LEPGKHPIGLGIRTPAVIVSPWSRGGYVCSELFDHTSVIRFMERCFGVHEPNISPWRRSVCGDLTSAFDFTAPTHRTRLPKLPATNDFLERIARSAAGSTNSIPERQSPTAQMPGQRPHRPLPYNLDVIATVTPQRRLRLEMINRGSVGAVISVHDNLDLQEPWHYTIGAGDRLLSEQWHDDGPLDAYDLTLRGPNGYWRRYAGPLGTDATPVEVALVAYPAEGAIELMLSNNAAAAREFSIVLDERYPTHGPRALRISVGPGKTVGHRLRLDVSDNWYDLTVTVEADAARNTRGPAFLRRFAGKVENGRPGRTDPGIGAMQITA
jgi:phospholipase C